MALVSIECEYCARRVVAYRSPSARPARFCSLRCLGKAQRGEGNPSFRGGRYIDSNGYVLVHRPDHHLCDVRGYVYEHRLVGEILKGRPLIEGEVVHHLNGLKADNRPDNLEVLSSQSDHAALHAAERHP